jgi:hypothetical protein
MFREPLDDSRHAIDQAMVAWHSTLEGVDMSTDLAGEPYITNSDEGFRVVFHIRPGSRLWRDWAVALVSDIRSHLAPNSS